MNWWEYILWSLLGAVAIVGIFFGGMWVFWGGLSGWLDKLFG